MDKNSASDKWDLSNSPFAAVLGTNHAPKSSELGLLKATLVEPQHDLDRLESRIALLQTVLDGLLSNREKIKVYINAHRALMSPIRQIPPETLADIFSWCLPSESAYGLRTTKQAPLLMTEVCRRWRRIAIETPRLWRSLHVYFFRGLSENDAVKRIAGVELWLERSSSLPISLSLHADPTFQSYSPCRAAQKNLELLLQTLSRFRDRLRHVYLCLARDDLTVFNSQLSLFSSFPALISLRLGEYYRTQGIDTNYPILSNRNRISLPMYSPLFSQMPALKRLELEVKERELQYRALPCNWFSLTNLTIREDLAPPDLLGLLSQTPQLRSLEIGVLVVQDSDRFHESFLPVATLTKLTSMSLSFSSNHPPLDSPMVQEMDISTIFLHLICPSLKSLSMCWRSTPAIISRIPFLGLPLHALETMNLDLPLTAEALTECLSNVPNVTSLGIVNHALAVVPDFIVTLQDSHLLGLTHSATSLTSFCPRLRHFRMMDSFLLRANRRIGWSPKCLTEFIEAKSRQLSSCDVFVYASDEFTEAELHRLQRTKLDGLELHLYQNKNIPIPPVPKDSPTEGLIRRRRSPLPLPPPSRHPVHLSDLDAYELFDVEVIL